MPVDPTIDDPEQVTLLDQCARFTDELAADDGVLSADTAAHVAQCLRCQAEIANYKRMRRVMRSLADHDDVEVSDLEHRILVALDAADGHHRRRRRGSGGHRACHPAPSRRSIRRLIRRSDLRCPVRSMPRARDLAGRER